MKILKLFNDPRIYAPFILMLIFEGFMQTGLYRHLLRPDSYAFNVNRVRKILLESDVKPDILVIGTSVPYQGLNMPLLNSLMQKEGLTVQNASTEGAMIEVQYAMSRDLVKKLPSFHTVVFVADMALAWKTRYKMSSENRSMLAQFDRSEVFHIANEMKYDLDSTDYTFFLFRSLSYQSDLRDFALNPLYRIKKISREREVQSSSYPHINKSPYSLAGLGITSIHDCVRLASRKTLIMDEKGLIRNESGQQVSDKHHQRAAVQTCNQAAAEMADDIDKYAKWRELYFERLNAMFRFFHLNNKKIITVFPPYSNIVKGFNSDYKIGLWEQKLDTICKLNQIKCISIDSRNSLNEKDNLQWFYDVLHLNQPGSLQWTKKIAADLIRHKDFITGK